MANNAVPRMRASWTAVQRINAYAARRRVFTTEDVMRDINVAAAHGLDTAIAKGDLVRYGTRVHAIHGVHADDPRIIAALGHQRPAASPSILDQHRRSEEREAKRLEATLPGAEPAALLDRFLKKNPVFLRAQIKDAKLGKTDDLLKQLLLEERIHQVDQLYLVGNVEIGDQAVDAFLQAHTGDTAVIAIEIERAAKLKSGGRITYRFEKRGWTGSDGMRHDRRSRMHVLIPGYPPIHAETRGRQGTGISWYGKDISRLAAEAIARKAISPMPATFDAFVTRVERNGAPVEVTRRNTGEPVAAEVADRTPRARSVPIASRTILTIDTSEDDEILSALAGTGNLHVVRAQLPIGDYHLRSAHGEIIIERKTMKDLAASFEDGRLARQMPRLSSVRGRPFVLVEGNLWAGDVVAPARLMRFQTRLAALGIGFLVSPSTTASAYIIASLARDVLQGHGCSEIAA